jgi:3-oxoacyl-(acyl-carrier-protein) synthase
MAKDFMKKLMSMSGAVTERKNAYAEVLDTHSPSLNFTFNKAQKRDVKVLMSNTFGFGGHTACVLVKKFEI